MNFLNNISSILQDVDEENITTPLITAVLLNLEDYVKDLKRENRPVPFVQVAENLSKLFDSYLLATIKPTQNGLNFIRETIEFKKKFHGDTGREKDLLPDVSEINRKLNLLLSGQEDTDAGADSDISPEKQEPSQLGTEDLPMEYDLPISSEEDAESYEEFVHESTEHIENIENKIMENIDKKID